MYLAAMNPREQEDSVFDKLADGQLRRLERALRGEGWRPL